MGGRGTAGRHRPPRPVTLAQIKAEPALAKIALVRNSRLSVSPSPPTSSTNREDGSVRTHEMLDQLTILAPGLLGGSVARSARSRRVARRIVIWARRRETAEALAGQPWCDAVAQTPEAAAEAASLVVVAAPSTRSFPRPTDRAETFRRGDRHRRRQRQGADRPRGPRRSPRRRSLRRFAPHGRFRKDRLGKWHPDPLREPRLLRDSAA